MITRAPRHDDVGAVIDLMRAADIAAYGDSDWAEADLREEWQDADVFRDARLVEVDGVLAGYVSVQRRGGGRVVADGYVHPDQRGRGVGSALVEAVEARAALELERVSGRVFIHFASIVGDGEAPAFFAARGYRDVRHTYRMVIDLDEPPGGVQLAGVDIRPYEVGEERAIHAVIQEAWRDGGWEFQPMPFDEWAKGVFAREGHDRSLCRVAVADGELVGASLNDWKRNGDWGWIGTIGVRPRWRRRGIGEALLKASFGEFFRRGERRVALGVDAQSPTGATRLYERAGMRVLYDIAVYEKELRGA